MKIFLLLIIIAALICIAAGCSAGRKTLGADTSKSSYQQITQEEAQRIMDFE